MKGQVLKIFEKIGIHSGRTRNIAKHIGWSVLFKIGSTIANFLIVPLTISYLNQEKYGIWLTISTFISWFSFLDIGLGNGLRNNFAKAISRGEIKVAKAYVSTAYFTLGFLSVGFFLFFLFLNPFINWIEIFNANEGDNETLYHLMPIIFGLFFLQLVVKLITSIYQGNQNHSIQNKVQFISQILILILIYILTKFDYSSLLYFGVIISAVPVLVLISFNFYGFNADLKQYRPKLMQWKREYLKDITGLGIKFFVIQIATIILISTDNFIISHLFGPKEVVPYNLAYKYFSVIIMGFSLVVAPYWSSFTEAYTDKDFSWIKKSIHNIQLLWMSIPVFICLMVFYSSKFYEIWIGDEVQIPISLTISMAVYILVFTFFMIYNIFINGVGKIKIHLIVSSINLFLNIPLSILFAKTFNLGVTGVLVGTIVTTFLNTFFMPLQYKMIVNNKAKGWWNE